MPTHPTERLYSNAVQWIRENPEDQRLSEEMKRDFLRFNELSPKNKVELIIALRKNTGLPEEIEQSLPYLTFDLDALPDDMLLEMGSHLKNESDMSNLVSTSKIMYSLFQPRRLLNKFLQRIAYGEQDKAERLFTDVYQGNVKKIQQALLHQGKFTDYSGRTFKCSAYEYAYWAKDTHMCRMLERYMDDKTKAQMLTRIDAIEDHGLTFQQNDKKHRSAHFDFTPLKEAYQRYIAGHNAWDTAQNWEAMDAAWRDVGKAQRNVPAHVAQEYCRPDRSFDPRPEFKEETLPRVLTFHNWITGRDDSWFPLAAASNSGLGFDFALVRRRAVCCGLLRWAYALGAVVDLAAIIRLDDVRTVDLTQSREHLNPPAMSQSRSV